MEPLTAGSGEHRRRRRRRHALVATDAVDDVGAQANRREATIGVVDGGRILVGSLIDAIERVRLALRVGGGRAIDGWFVLATVGGNRAGVGEGAAAEILDGRLHQGDRADDVDAGAPNWIGLAERHLKRSQMDDVRGLVLGKAGHDGCRVGDVERVARQAGGVVANEVA